MASIDDGGPAFPVASQNEHGLSKLDWFAGQALMSLHAPAYMSWEHIAEDAYDIAEAMLAERRKR